jgi:hypothetical protein
MATVKKPAKKMQMGGDTSMMKMGGTMAKNGKKFPDLNKDGKITKADILKGRGVIAKKGMKIKKAQNGYDDKLRYPKDAKKSYEESGNPKINLVKPKTGPRLVDTTGYSAGRNIFPTKSTKPVPGTGYGKAKRKDVEKSIQASKNKNGGMTKKCKYGCK